MKLHHTLTHLLNGREVEVIGQIGRVVLLTFSHVERKSHYAVTQLRDYMIKLRNQSNLPPKSYSPGKSKWTQMDRALISLMHG